MNTGHLERIYAQLFEIADADKDGRVGTQDGLVFFQRSGLSKEVLGHIWSQVNQPPSPHLTPQQFAAACTLIALAQNNVAPNLSELAKMAQLPPSQVPLPNLQGIAMSNLVQQVTQSNVRQIFFTYQLSPHHPLLQQLLRLELQLLRVARPQFHGPLQKNR